MMAWQLQLQADAATLEGRLLFGEPMSRYTSWAVGGPADVVYRPSCLEDLAAFMALLPIDVDVHWVGLGSNLLVRDAGVRGAVILLKSTLQELTLEGDKVIAQAGVTCARLARQVANWGFADSAFFAGIPGTLGGALAMNAGAHGGETWRQVEAVQVMFRDGHMEWLDPSHWNVSYRTVLAKFEQAAWFVAARLGFTEGDAEASVAAIRDLQAHRAATQPIDQRSCGSVFRNPEGDHAARLIEVCGLKGERLGGAQVSSKHANFIVNADGASAADIEQLLNRVRQVVKEQQGVDLHPEVRVIGDALKEAA